MRASIITAVAVIATGLVVVVVVPGCGVLGLSALPCVDDVDCTNGDLCVDGRCAVALAGGEGEGEEGEGEGEIGEGEGEGEAGEGEGEGDVGEGEGEGEGEGDVGEGEGEGEVPFVGCGDGVVIDPEQCDGSNALGGDGCTAHCEIEIARCGIQVPPAFASVTSTAIAGVAPDAASGCFDSIETALVSRPGQAVYVAPGTYALEPRPLEVNVPMIGASREQVVIGELTDTSGVTLELNGGAVLSDVTVIGGRNASQADVIEIGFASGEVVLRDVDVRGPGDLVFLNGGPNALTIERSRFVNTSTVATALFSGTSSTGTIITVTDSRFDGADLAIFGAGDFIFNRNEVDLVQNSLNNVDPGEGRSVTMRDNHFFSSAQACQFGLALEDGVFSLDGNHFDDLPCVALRIDAADGIGQSVAVSDPAAGNVSRFNGNEVDIQLDAPITVEAEGTSWSQSPDPCPGIVVANPAGLVDLGATSCGP